MSNAWPTEAEQGGQPERRIGRFLKSKVSGRRRVTLVVIPPIGQKAMADISRDDPQAVVLAFAKAYTAWENRVHRTRDGLRDCDLQQQHDEIIRNFCTHKKRAYVDGCYSYQTPPAYKQVVERNIVNVEAVSHSRVHVDTNQLEWHAYRFVVIKKSDGWRIDGVKWRSSDDEEWENTLIGS